MTRGKSVLYNQLIPNSVAKNKGNGRKPYLEARHSAMACRYYYHAYICRRRYDDCLNHLSEEFFLSPQQIVNQLQSRLALINSMVEDDMPPAELRKRYPFFDWSLRAS